MVALLPVKESEWVRFPPITQADAYHACVRSTQNNDNESGLARLMKAKSEQGGIFQWLRSMFFTHVIGVRFSIPLLESFQNGDIITIGLLTQLVERRRYGQLSCM